MLVQDRIMTHLVKQLLALVDLEFNFCALMVIKTPCSSRSYLIMPSCTVYPVTTQQQCIEPTELLLGSEEFISMETQCSSAQCCNTDTVSSLHRRIPWPRKVDNRCVNYSCRCLSSYTRVSRENQDKFPKTSA